MEFNIKFDKKMMVEAANKLLDEFEYSGKTIREWADLLANPRTNADRIRAMTDEELAVWISALYSVQYHAKASPHYWLDWLREEANNDP